MNLLFSLILSACWYSVLAEEPIVLLKDEAANLQSPDLNDTPQVAENSKEKVVNPSTKIHADNIDTYTSGLTPQFRTLLLAPESGESQHHRKTTKDPQKERNPHENDEKGEIYAFEGIPQAHLDQLLRYYGKIAGKLLPTGYTKFRKITTEKDKVSDSAGKQDEPAETKEATPFTEPTNPEPPKPTPSTEHVVNTAVNAAIAALQATSTLPGYGSLNYLNAASYGPPTPANSYATALRNRMLATNYIPHQGGYTVSNCCNVCQPCSTQNVYENSCGGGISNPNLGLNTMTNGCPGSEYSNTDTDDDYGPDNYLGGYGTNTQSHESTAGSSRHSQLLSGYASPSTASASLYGSSKQQPGNYYQVSSPVSNPFLVDSHPYSPTGSIFATSHMHHSNFGSYPTLNTNPFQQYFGTLHAYPNNQRYNYGNSMSDSELNAQNLYGYTNGASPFGPMFDYQTSETESTTTSSNAIQPIMSTTEKSKEMINEDHAPIENVFHIVKPNFASLKKAALMKKHRTNTMSKGTRKPNQTNPPSTTVLTTQKPTTIVSSTSIPLTTSTRSVLVARKMAKILIAKKSSTPAPKTVPTKVTENTTTVSTTTKKLVKIVTSTQPNNVTKKSRFY